MVHVELSWDLMPPEEKVVSYQIERRPTGPSHDNSRIKRWAYNLTTRNLFGGWRRVATVPGNTNKFRDDRAFNLRKITRPTYMHNSNILSDQSYEYRIRAINSSGRKGYWINIMVDATGSSSVSGSKGSRPNPVKIISARMNV